MSLRWPRFAETAPNVEARPHRPWVFIQVMIAAALTGAMLGVAFAALSGRGQISAYAYDLWRWEVETVPGVVVRLLGASPSMGELSEDEILHRYFALTSEIRDETNVFEPDRGRLAALREERAQYERRVEHIIRQRIDHAVREIGLQETLPFFTDVDITWPPVEFALTEPPHVLVRSPRDQIVRGGDRLLRGDLSLDDIDEVEAMVEGPNTASLVVQIGGIAAYPAIIRADRNYWGVVETAAHEWLHHYLAFYPLGQQWMKGGDAFALNETVANIGGRAIAGVVHRLYPMDFPDALDGSWFAREERTVDFNAEMRQLRLRVDALLEEGRVEEAEALMEETRLHLAENGVVIRRLNQAYFAFYGTYADGPASSDPIGPKVEQVWQYSDEDMAVFIALMRDVKTVDDLDDLLDGLEATFGPLSQT
jgi:hypothetical protein